MLIDTDVLIWYLRGNRKALETINQYRPFSISAVTYIELVQGMRNKNELQLLQRAMQQWGCHTIYLSEKISAKAVLYVEQHFLSHSLQLADALIGATAAVHNLSLLTANSKHYAVIKDIDVIRFTP
jgi:predicted nucleic acid-binding protein